MAILYISSTHIGDAVLSTGLLAWLLERYPDDKVTIACGAPAAKVLEATPRLEALHVIRKRPSKGHWLDLWRATAGRRWRLVVDLRRSIMPWILRAERRAVLPKSEVGEHRVVLIARTLGLPPQDPVVWTRPEHEDRAAALLGADGNVVALGAGANWVGKMWPMERFLGLARQLTAGGGLAPGARIMLVGSGDEREAVRPLFEALPEDRIVDAMGLDVLSTFAALKRCRLMVGNDSAMMHLAAATGRPTVGLFGPTRDEHYGPWGDNGLVVRTPQSVEELIGHADYDTRTTPTMMGGLTVETVEAAIRRRWPELPSV